MSSVPNRDPGGVPAARQHLLASFDREHATTLRVLKALPKEKSELRPAPACKTARELAWMFVLAQGAMEKGLTSGFDWSKPPAFPPPRRSCLRAKSPVRNRSACGQWSSSIASVATPPTRPRAG